MWCVTATRNSVVQKWRFRVPKNHDKKRKTRDANIFGQKKGWEISLESFRGSRWWHEFPSESCPKILKIVSSDGSNILSSLSISFRRTIFSKEPKNEKQGRKLQGHLPSSGVAQNKNPALQLVDSRSYIKNILPQLIIDSLFILIRTNIVIISYDDKLI